MKRFRSFSLISTAAMLFAMISWGGLLHAQDTTTPSTPPQTQEPATPPQQPDTPAPSATSPSVPDQAAPTQAPPPDTTPQSDATGTKEFVGTVVKQGDKYMFQDTSTGATYDIDHQDEVKKFDGKKVRIRGTLENNTIHVQ